MRGNSDLAVEEPELTGEEPCPFNISIALFNILFLVFQCFVPLVQHYLCSVSTISSLLLHVTNEKVEPVLP